MKLALTYAILALVATVANMGAQMASMLVHRGRFDVLLSMAVGTAVGLVVKYLLDKRFIFAFKARDMAHDGQTFLLYTVMGLLTTLIFWAMEWIFHLWFDSAAMRYLGGVIGLAIGYWCKYRLDRRFVFRSEAT